MDCPHPDCEYESSERGVKIHYGWSHEGTISGTLTECHHCGEEVRKHDYRFDRSDYLFCSQDCHYEWKREVDDAIGGPPRKRVEVDCSWCGRTIEKRQCRVENAEYPFCSDACRGEWDTDTGSKRGENNGRWRGGKEKYYGPNWLRQRRKAVERDNRECQHCGVSQRTVVEENGRGLDVHHITPLRTFKPFEEEEDWEEANALSNLLTLCQSCHMTLESSLQS